MINLIKKELHQKVKTELNKNMNNIIFESTLRISGFVVQWINLRVFKFLFEIS